MEPGRILSDMLAVTLAGGHFVKVTLRQQVTTSQQQVVTSQHQVVTSQHQVVTSQQQVVTPQVIS